MNKLVTWLRSLLDDGLNHDWDGELANEDAVAVQEYLREVEDRAPLEDKVKAWSMWLIS